MTASRFTAAAIQMRSTKDPLKNRDDAVRMIRDDIEVTGRGWTYDHRAKKVSLAADVRIVFAAQLNDILK